jgi:hypothetical protein
LFEEFIFISKFLISLIWRNSLSLNFVEFELGRSITHVMVLSTLHPQWSESNIQKLHATIFCVAQPQSAVKGISILIKTRRSAATSQLPLPPPAAAQSPKRRPQLL